MPVDSEFWPCNSVDGVGGIGQAELLGPMRIQVNGREYELPGAISVLHFIESLGWDARKIAVERNLEIVPRSAHATTLLHEGDRLEIVNFVGGG